MCVKKLWRQRIDIVRDIIVDRDQLPLRVLRHSLLVLVLHCAELLLEIRRLLLHLSFLLGCKPLQRFDPFAFLLLGQFDLQLGLLDRFLLFLLLHRQKLSLLPGSRAFAGKHLNVDLRCSISPLVEAYGFQSHLSLAPSEAEEPAAPA